MKIKCFVNNKKKIYDINGDESLYSVLRKDGYLSVRDSDDAEGFTGSDTIIFNGYPQYSNLINAALCDNANITTIEGIAEPKDISILQQAMIDAGIVQSAYNAPAACLLLNWLLERNPNPTKEEIKDVLSGIFVRDASYENYYLAVKLAIEKKAKGKYLSRISDQFRPELKYIGHNVSKIDSKSLVKGTPRFVEDKLPPSYCVLKVLRSPHASAYIKSVDISKAEKVEGVIKIITAFNCPDVYYMKAGQGNPEPSPYDTRLFNYKVRHIGDRVAGIVAENEEAANKAMKLIKVDYEVLKPVFTVEDAMAEGAPIVQNGIVEYRSGVPENLEEYNKGVDKREGKVIYQFPLHADIRKNIAASARGAIGDVEKGFAEADEVVERTYQSSQVQCTPLEPHVCFAKMEKDRLVIHASTQVPWHLRRIVGLVCGISENNIHVIKEHVGGGYGSKQDILVEDLTAYAAWLTGRAVYYRNTREEEFIANSTRHPMRVNVKIGGKKDGTITAIQMDVRANTGPYGNHCLTVPMNSCSKTLPLFKVPNMKFQVITYYTNTPPAGAYQGYGAPKGTFGLMMAVAELADKLGVDYKNMIEKNHVDTGYMLDILANLGEGRAGNVVPVGSCGLYNALKTGCDMIKWGSKDKDEGHWKYGKGFAIVQQGSGLPGLDHANCLAKLATDGSVIMLSGGADLGTGLDTVTAKCAAEVLKLPIDKVVVVSGDTDATPFDVGSYASSGTFFSGGASLKAAEKLKEKILTEASLQMSENRDDLYIEYPGKVISKKTGAELSYYSIIHTALSGTGRGQLIAQGTFTTEHNSIPYGAHFAEVAVNELTGQVKVKKFYAIQDAGTPINPELAECQMYGAALKSIGHSLYENMILDEKGKCVNANFTDYGVPMISEMPEDFKAVLVDVNDEAGPFGAKSISEIATNGAAPAIAIAIHDAVGVWVRSWPFTAEKILKEMGKIEK